MSFDATLRHLHKSENKVCRCEFSVRFNSATIREIFSRREHAPAQEVLSTTVPDLLRPVHPTVLALTQKMPRIFIPREPEGVKPEQHQARRPVWSLPPRLPR